MYVQLWIILRQLLAGKPPFNFKGYSYQDVTVLSIYGKTRSEMISIIQGLTENPVSAYHSIKLLLSFNA